MDCPKCAHQQTDTVKCASCGIYFAKFAQQRALVASRSGAAHDELPDSGFGWSALALTAILSMALAWYVLRGHATAPAARPARAGELSGGARATCQRGEGRRADPGRTACAVGGRLPPARAAGS